MIESFSFIPYRDESGSSRSRSLPMQNGTGTFDLSDSVKSQNEQNVTMQNGTVSISQDRRKQIFRIKKIFSGKSQKGTISLKCIKLILYIQLCNRSVLCIRSGPCMHIGLYCIFSEYVNICKQYAFKRSKRL